MPPKIFDVKIVHVLISRHYGIDKMIQNDFLKLFKIYGLIALEMNLKSLFFSI